MFNIKFLNRHLAIYKVIETPILYAMCTLSIFYQFYASVCLTKFIKLTCLNLIAFSNYLVVLSSKEKVLYKSCLNTV